MYPDKKIKNTGKTVSSNAIISTLLSVSHFYISISFRSASIEKSFGYSVTRGLY
jgi:hypothetical protein